MAEKSSQKAYSMIWQELMAITVVVGDDYTRDVNIENGNLSGIGLAAHPMNY